MRRENKLEIKSLCMVGHFEKIGKKEFTPNNSVFFRKLMKTIKILTFVNIVFYVSYVSNDSSIKHRKEVK